MNDIDLAWAAGLFEGEGSIKIDYGCGSRGHNQCRLSVAIGMTDLQILQFFHRRWGGSLSPASVRPECRPQWRWAVVSRMAARFLSDVLPYFHSARVQEKAGIALAFQHQKAVGRSSIDDLIAYRERQWDFHAQMRELNRRGVRQIA